MPAPRPSAPIPGAFAAPSPRREPTASPRGEKGRGAATNHSGRFEPFTRVLTDDGWGALDEDAPPRETVLMRDATRKVIARNTSPDLGFDRSVNPYRGCEHGCIYCYARPTHAYLGLSPGLDFETRIMIKPDAGVLLAAELMDAAYTPAPLALGTNTDPYQPAERTQRITRGVLETLSRFHHPVTIVTKSHLVTRDIDILAPMAERGLARVAISVTTLDRRLARMMEPRAATPERRLETIKSLSAAGIPVSVMAAPVIPALTDHELEAILQRAAEAGATGAGYVVLRLPLEIKDLWRDFLETRLPAKAAHVMALVRSMRGGRDYDPEWGRRQRGTGPYADLIAQRFAHAARRFGLNRTRTPLDVTQFRRPPQPGEQLSLI